MKWRNLALTGLTLLLFPAIFIAPCRAQQGEDSTGKVFPALGDYIDNRDQIYNRYAFQVMGESWNQKPNEVPGFAPFCCMKIVDVKSEFDFDGYGKLLKDPHPMSKQREDWLQMLRCGGKLGILAGTINPRETYRIKPPDMKLGAFKTRCGYYQIQFQPLEDILTIAVYYFFEQSNRAAAERVFLKRAELISSDDGVQGTVRSDWHWRWGDSDLDIRLTQSSAHGNMPIRVEYSDRQPKYNKFYSDTHIQWSQQNDVWVPTKINAASIVNYQYGEGTQTQVLAKIDWLIGDEVTGEMLQCNASDHRLPLMQAFGHHFDSVVAGQTITGDPWERNEDLVIEVAKNATEAREKTRSP